MADLISDTDADTDPRFYMTYWRSRPNVIVPYAESQGIGFLENAMHRWSDAQERLLHMWNYDTPHVIDSGGYTAQRKRGDFPFTVQQYHEWLAANADEIEWAACMDYACATGDERTGADAFANDWSTETRIEKTIENAVAQFNLIEDADNPYTALPVLQGLTLEDMLWCYDQYQDYGIPTDFLGVGTIVRLSTSNELVELERSLRAQIGDVRLHGFGVKADSFKRGVAFESADSQVWTYGPSYGMVYVRQPSGALIKEKPDELCNEGHDPRCARRDRSACLGELDDQGRKRESFEVYYDYASRLQREALADRDLH